MNRALGACNGYVSYSASGYKGPAAAGRGSSFREADLASLPGRCSQSHGRRVGGHTKMHLDVEKNLKAAALKGGALGASKVRSPLVQVVVHSELNVLVLPRAHARLRASDDRRRADEGPVDALHAAYLALRCLPKLLHQSLRHHGQC
jgi:hypothetical protein